jgi:hypothetical protein
MMPVAEPQVAVGWMNSLLAALQAVATAAASASRAGWQALGPGSGHADDIAVCCLQLLPTVYQYAIPLLRPAVELLGEETPLMPMIQWTLVTLCSDHIADAHTCFSWSVIFDLQLTGALPA